jgi:hypothetical protein
MNTVITIKCLPEDLSAKLDEAYRKMMRTTQKNSGWVVHHYPEFSLHSVLPDDSNDILMIHYINVTYKE